ncbi:MAG: hypothetical protein ACN4GF_09140, partial [Lentimonas sp.]
MNDFLLPILLLSLVSNVSASEILMRFGANEDYVCPIGSDGKPSLETYIFYIGEYYPSAYETEDEAISFDSVARILVEQ